MNQLVRILMDRDEITKDEAEDMIQECIELINDGESIDDSMMEVLGLEMDYFDGLMEYM